MTATARPYRLAFALAALAAGGGMAGGLEVGLFGMPGAAIWGAAGLLAGAGLGLAITRIGSADRAALHAAQEQETALLVGAMIRLGRDGRILWANDAAAEVLGRPSAELVGQSVTGFALGSTRNAVQAALARVSYFGAATEVRFQRRGEGDENRWIALTARPVFTAARPMATSGGFGAVALLTDVSAIVHTEQRLRAERDDARAAADAKAWFLASMSHELRTPLNAIIGFSEMMAAEMFGPLGDTRYREYADHVKESGEHLRDLINDVLDVSKVEAGRFELSLETVSMPRVLDEALKAVSVLAKQRRIRLGVEFADDLPPLTGDRRALKQLLLNLLANALKFTPERGHVTATARAEDGHMILAVRDTGIGMSDNLIARIGHRYAHGRAAPNLKLDDRADKSTGLGLALVKTFAELHGGTLDVQSAEGQGTCVTVSLPLDGPGGHRVPSATKVA